MPAGSAGGARPRPRGEKRKPYPARRGRKGVPPGAHCQGSAAAGGALPGAQGSLPAGGSRTRPATGRRHPKGRAPLPGTVCRRPPAFRAAPCQTMCMMHKNHPLSLTLSWLAVKKADIFLKKASFLQGRKNGTIRPENRNRGGDTESAAAHRILSSGAEPFRPPNKPFQNKVFAKDFGQHGF